MPSLPASSPSCGRAVLLAAVFALLPLAVHAQAKPAVPHTVAGTVVNGANAPVPGAVVYLENPKSLDVQSYLTDNAGHFHFNHITAETDYEVWAELNGLQSRHKFLSQFSSKVHTVYTLKLGQKRRKFLGIF